MTPVVESHSSSVAFKSVQYLFLISLSLSILLFFSTIVTPFAIALLSLNRNRSVDPFAALNVTIGTIIRTIGAIAGDSGNWLLLVLFAVSMATVNSLALVNSQIALSARVDALDALHVLSNTLATLFALVFAYVIKSPNKFDPKFKSASTATSTMPKIVIHRTEDSTDDEAGRQSAADSKNIVIIIEAPSTSSEDNYQ